MASDKASDGEARVKYLVIIPPVQITHGSTWDWVEEECAAQGDAAVDDVVPDFAHAGGEKHIFHRQMQEDGLHDFVCVEEALACGFARWLVCWSLGLPMLFGRCGLSLPPSQ